MKSIFWTKKFDRLHRTEVFIVFFFAVAVLALITNIDIIFHDSYVLPLISSCKPENPSPLEACKIFLQSTAEDLDIGRPYWNLLAAMIVMFAAMPAVFRALLGSIKTGFVYFYSIFLPVVGGVEDFYYYSARGLVLPAELPWLDSQPFISYTRFLTGTEHVTSQGLGISILFGFLSVILLWYIVLRTKSKGIF